MLSISELIKISTQVRRDIVRMTGGAKSGHPGGSLGCADFMTALFFNHMQANPHKFKILNDDEDAFFLSNGHISPVLYSVLARFAYFPVADLSGFRKLGSPLQGHPSVHQGLPGIRMASGSLGQGLSNAIGAALGRKLNGKTSLVYTLHGDGEMQEGQIWEAAMYAGAKKVDNLIATIDCNGLQIDGSTDDVCSLGSLKDKFLAFAWHVIEADGNDMQAIDAALTQAKLLTGKGKPVLILMKTVMGKGVDFMENNCKWHGSAPNEEQVRAALSQLEETLGDY